MKVHIVRRSIEGLRRVLGGRCSGSTLLWVIGAVVVLGALGTAVGLMSPSATRSKLEQEAGMRAYYNANAGLNFINSMNAAGASGNVSFSNFTNLMGGTNTVTYALPNSGTFAYQLGNFVANGVNGTYQVTSLIGSVENAAGSDAYSYVIYGGGRGYSDVKRYTVVSSGGNVPPADYAEFIGFSGNYYGDFIIKDAYFNGGVNIYGSIDYVGTGVNSGGDTCLHLYGGIVGLSDGSSHICSNTCVILDGGNTYYGTIYSQGDVTVNNGTLYGDIHAGGNVNITWSGTVYGNIYVHGTYTTVSPSRLKNGTVHTGSPVPAKCADYSLPNHETYSSSNPLNLTYTQANNWTGQMTISGVANIDDHTNEYSSVTLDGGTSLCLDLSTPGTYINFFVSGDFTNNGTIYVKTISGENCFQSKNTFNSSNYKSFAYSKYASRVYMDVSGQMTLNGGSNWFGTAYSKGDITLGGGAAIIGALYTNGGINRNSSGGDLQYFVKSDYATKNW